MSAEIDPIPLSGKTRIYAIVGDPIAQVKSPAGVTRSFHARGRDAICIPAHVSPDDLPLFLQAAERLQNFDGVIVTVPHKFASFGHCASASERAAFLGVANVMRRDGKGGWEGDMVDGLGFVGALRSNGCDPKGRRALLVGAGGAGSAIALALVEAGVVELAIHDPDAARRDRLIARLNGLGKARVFAGSADPAGFDLVANATPLGMKEGDPLPLDVTRLSPQAFVGCVITSPAVSPLIAAARELGCGTSTGSQMYLALQESMVDFLLFNEAKA